MALLHDYLGRPRPDWIIDPIPPWISVLAEKGVIDEQEQLAIGAAQVDSMIATMKLQAQALQNSINAAEQVGNVLNAKMKMLKKQK